MAELIRATKSPAHAGLVRRLAIELCARASSRVTVEALLQAGMLELNDAASSYDRRQGDSFATFASRRVCNAMLAELAAAHGLPQGVSARLRQVRSAVQRLERRLGRVPHAREVAADLGWSLHELQQRMADAGAGAIRFDDAELERLAEVPAEGAALEAQASPYPNDDARTDPLAALQRRERAAALRDAFAALDARSRHVMEMIDLKGMSLRTVGATFGISESRVCQLHAATLAKLRRLLSAW